MAWLDQSTFKQSFRIASKASDQQLDMAYAAAQDELYDLLTDALVDDAILEPPVLDSSARIIRAHSYLAYSIHLLNIREVKRSQDDASPATAQTVTTEYYTPKELIELSNQWRARAMKTLDLYLPIGSVFVADRVPASAAVRVVSDW